MDTIKMKYFKELYGLHQIYHVITGSTCQGLDIHTDEYESDIDTKSIVLLPRKALFQLHDIPDTLSFHLPDVEYHLLKKFFLLLMKQNPTILEMLWCDPRFILFQNEAGKMLRDNREIFLSQFCYESFGAYTREQLYKIQSGLNNAPEFQTIHLKNRLERLVLSFDEKYPAFSTGDFLISQFNEKEASVSVRYDAIPITQLQGMLADISNVVRSTRNAKRIQSETHDKLYKHAMHLVRLVKMAIEVLRTGHLQVFRLQDRDELLSIRNKKWSWESFFQYVDYLMAELEQAKLHSVLPVTADQNKINTLYQKMMLLFSE